MTAEILKNPQVMKSLNLHLFRAGVGGSAQGKQCEGKSFIAKLLRTFTLLLFIVLKLILLATSPQCPIEAVFKVISSTVKAVLNYLQKTKSAR